MAVLVPLIVFGGSAALLMTVKFPWTPSAEGTHWSVSFAIAAFVGAASGGPLAWWAQRERPEPGGADPAAAGGRVSQRAKLGKESQSYMAGRDVRINDRGEREK
ncbi:hypothetical protein [Nocardia vaccinii]|uniref:hypothetical protein n=1 Tax=Nocardia vaccinii TaxID=1822 RepID=UPI000B124740|nr:hypothetical protein [Nocardia vaccinii]